MTYGRPILISSRHIDLRTAHSDLDLGNLCFSIYLHKNMLLIRIVGALQTIVPTTEVSIAIGQLILFSTRTLKNKYPHLDTTIGLIAILSLFNTSFQACVAMHNGRMFLCCSDVIPVAEVGGEGTFLITELGSSSCIHSVTSIRNTKG